MHKSLLIALAVAGLGFGAVATPQSSLPENQTATSSQSTQKTVKKNAVQPGDRNCLRSTGSLIPAKEGACLPVAGRSYSGDELRRTGYNDTGHALEALDPSVSIGH